MMEHGQCKSLKRLNVTPANVEVPFKAPEVVKRGIGSGAGTQVPAFLQELEHRRRHLHNDPESLNNGLSHELFKQPPLGSPLKGG